MSGTIQVYIDDLQSKEIITDKNVADLRRFISVKYPQNSPQKSAVVFADAIHRIIDREICVMSDGCREKIKQYLIENSIKKKSFSIHAKDIFDACLKISDEENGFMEEFYEWARAAMDTFIPKSLFYEFVDQLKQAAIAQSENRIAESVRTILVDSKYYDTGEAAYTDKFFEKEIYDFEYSDYTEKAIKEEADCARIMLLNSVSRVAKSETLPVVLSEPEIEEPWTDLEYNDYIEKAIEEENEFINKIFSESPVQLNPTNIYMFFSTVMDAVLSGIKTYSLDACGRIKSLSKEITVMYSDIQVPVAQNCREILERIREFLLTVINKFHIKALLPEMIFPHSHSGYKLFQKTLLGTAVFASIFTGTLYSIFSGTWMLENKMQTVSGYLVPREQTALLEGENADTSDNSIILIGSMEERGYKKTLVINEDNKKPSSGGASTMPRNSLSPEWEDQKFGTEYGWELAYIIDKCTMKLDMKATAYDLSVESCGKRPDHPEYGITFSGIRAQKGRTVAVDPYVIPLGSRIYISFPEKFKNMDGIYIAEDTGVAVKGDIIDIFFGEDDKGEKNIYNKALEFGIQKVTVFVLG